jgi:hypothetical protein
MSVITNELDSIAKSLNESPLHTCKPETDKEIARTRIANEFELCYKELVKCREIEANKATIPYQKLQHHDPEKWKKKMKMLLDRERMIAVDGHITGAFDLRKA